MTPDQIKTLRAIQVALNKLLDQAESQNKPLKKVAFVIGHNQGSQGAINNLGESEWKFNQLVFDEIRDLKPNFMVKKFLRPPYVSYGSQVEDIVEQLKSYKPDLVINMHFNGGSSKATGTEALVLEKTGANDNLFADIFTDEVAKEYGLKQRYDDGVFEISAKHNGGYMLRRLNESGYTAVLIEPAFNSAIAADQQVFKDKLRYAKVIVRAIDKYFDKVT